jgi:hypothetical protein
VRFAQYDEMVETFLSDRPDQSFRKTVLPRRAASDGFVTDAHSSHAACDHRAIDTIPITDQIAGSLVPRECLADLASNPLGSGICGDGNPDQAPAGQSNNDKAIEQIKANVGATNKSMAAMSGAWLAYRYCVQLLTRFDESQENLSSRRTVWWG